MMFAKQTRVTTPDGRATVLGHRRYRNGQVAGYAVRLDNDPDRTTWYDPSALTVNDGLDEREAEFALFHEGKL
jgi:hypothetical protein